MNTKAQIIQIMTKFNGLSSEAKSEFVKDVLDTFMSSESVDDIWEWFCEGR